MPLLRKRPLQARSGIRNVTLKKLVATCAFCGGPSWKSCGQLCMIKLVQSAFSHKRSNREV